MERDFMGLNSKEPLAAVKEEIDDSAFGKGPASQWPFMNKLSALPHFMSPKVPQEDWGKKMNSSDPHASSGYMAISAVDAFDPRHKSSLAEFQKGFNQDRQGGNHFSTTAHSLQHDAHFARRSHDMKMFPGTNLSSPLFRTHFATTGHNLGGSVTVPHSNLPSVGSAAGISEHWSSSKPSGAPAQLTIFYNGAVNIFDDISPEKAQAIMFLAGNGSSTASNMGQSRANAQKLSPKAATGEGGLVNQPVNTPPSSALSSPISVSSHPVLQTGSGSTSSDELVAAKATPANKLEHSNAVSSMGAVAAKAMMPSAVPQARKASLARFLEKRKERVMNMAPYNLGRKAQECATPGSNGLGFSSGLVSGPLSASKEVGYDN